VLASKKNKAVKNYFSFDSDSIHIELKVIPGAGKNEFGGIRDGRLYVRITSPPENGRANENLRRFISDSFGCTKSSIKIIKGEKSRIKTIMISSANNSDLINKIKKLYLTNIKDV